MRIIHMIDDHDSILKMDWNENGMRIWILAEYPNQPISQALPWLTQVTQRKSCNVSSALVSSKTISYHSPERQTFCTLQDSSDICIRLQIQLCMPICVGLHQRKLIQIHYRNEIASFDLQQRSTDSETSR